MPYEDPDFPLTFHPFNDALNKDRDVMMAIITPRAILVNFFGSGKASNLTYEFYNPSALACQLAFGQLLIALCYTDVVKPRETITSSTPVKCRYRCRSIGLDPSSLHYSGIQTVVGGVERAFVLQIAPHIS